MDGIRKPRKKNTSNKIPINKKQETRTPRSIHKPKIKKVRKNKKSTSGDAVFSKPLHRKKERIDTKIILAIKKNWFWIQYPVKVVVVFGALFIIINQYQSTNITLRPHLEYIEVDQEVLAQKNPSEGTLGFEIIAITEEMSVPVTAAGKRDVARPARGEITILNTYSSEPQRLLPNTRFESAGGKVFMTGNQETIVPGGDEENPGTISVAVFASEPGPSYNIDSTDFTIPGFRELGLEDKYNSIYGYSSSAFNGGYLGTEPYITEEQQREAEEQMRNQLSDRLSLRLSKEKTDELILIENSAQLRLGEIESVFNADGTTGFINGSGTIIALGIGQNHLEEYIHTDIVATEEYPEIIILPNQSFSLNLIQPNFDFDAGTEALVQINGSPLFSWVVDTDQLKQDLATMPTDQLIEYFDNTESIDRAEVINRPLWRKKIANDSENISIGFEE